MDVPPRIDELILVGFDDPHGVAKEVRRHVAGIKHGRRTVVVSDPQAGYGSGLPHVHMHWLVVVEVDHETESRLSMDCRQ